jgi:protein TonB
VTQAAPDPAPARPRIVDVVFGASASTRPARWPSLVLALIGALSAHASLVLWARGSGQSLESWSAELAMRVHEALTVEELDEVVKPPPPPPAPAPEEPPPPSPASVREPIARAKAPSEKPQPPAQAAQILAVAPDPNAPLDLTGETFVTGNADAYAGGVTTASGTSRNPVRAVVPAAAPSPARHAQASAPDLSSAVALQEQNWSCPWPHEAEGEPIDEQVVVLRVWVRADGSVESASLTRDFGHGFGQAAVACALRTHFVPAKDRAGHALRAQSPPIVVRFTR